MELKEKRNKLIQILMIFLIASFYIFEDNSFGSIILLSLTIMILCAMAVEYNYRIPFNIERFHKFIMFFAIYCILSAVWAIDFHYAVEKGVTLIEILICMSVVYSYYSVRRAAMEELFSTLMWAGLIVIIYSYIFYGKDLIINAILHGSRLKNGFSNVNAIGMLSGVTIIVSVFKAIYDKRILYIFLDIPAFILILATESRKALLMALIGVFLVFMFKSFNRNIVKTITWIIFISILAWLFIVWLMSLEVFSGIETRMKGLIALITGRGIIDSSAILRQKYIELGIDIFKRNPIFGVGMGNARLFTSSNFGHDAYLHNNYVELLANGGICGFLTYYSIYYSTIKNIIKYFKYRDIYVVAVIILLVMQLLMDYGSVSYYYKNTIFYFLIFFICIKKMKERREYGITS